MAIKIRINKNGKPNKGDLNRAKKFIKANFDTIDPESLPKQGRAYYNQIERGKKQGARNAKRLRNPETGAFLSKPEAFEVNKRIDATAKDLGVSREEVIKNKEVLKDLTNLAINGTISGTKDTDLLIDFARRKGFKSYYLIDQNGKRKKVSLEKMIFTFKEAQQKITGLFKSEKFGSWNQFTFTPSGKNLEVKFYDPTGKTKEEIEQDLKQGEKTGEFGYYGS